MQPVVNLLDLMGHVFFIKLFKGKVRELKLGMGKPDIKIGTVNITRYYFHLYCYRYEMGYDGYVVSEVKVYKKVLIHLGGIISNVIMILFLSIVLNIGIINPNKYLYEIFFVLVYSIVINIAPFSSEGMNSAGKNIFNILKDRKRKKNLIFEDAIKECNEKIELNPNDINSYSAKGNMLCKYGKPEEAIKCFLEIINIRPDYWVGHYSMACAYSLENKCTEAIAYLKQALELDASCKVLAKIDTDFDNIKNSIEFKELIER